MLKSNNFGRDTDGERLERLLALSLNIDTHAVELGVAGARLTDCQTAGADWSGVCVVAGVEDGESQEATQTLNTGLSDAHTYYVAAKDVLQPIIDELEPDDEIVEEYAIKGDTPWDFKGLHHKIERWIETDARLKALLPPDPRVVNDTIIAALTAQLANITTLWHDARVQSQEASNAYAAKRAMFDKHSAILRILFGIAKMTWGADSQMLKDLGIVPSSEIWVVT